MNTPQLSIGIIIRFHYGLNDPRFQWRYDYFKNHVLPTIQAQKYKEFSVWIRCNEWHNEHFKQLGLNPFQVRNEGVRYKIDTKNNKRYFHDFVKWEDVIGMPKFDIQIGLDSDDLISPHFVSIIHKEVVRHIEKSPDKSLHICFQPRKKILKSGVIKQMRRYTFTLGSAFMALFQPDKSNYRFIYSESHLSIIRKADVAKVIPVGHCLVTVHDINESTR